MDLAVLVALQTGVVARWQLLEHGVAKHEIRRRLRRRELVRVHPGVHVGHTGPLTATQREWAAVLACWPAALCGASVRSRGSDGPVHVAIPDDRTLAPRGGVVTHRTAHLDARVRWNASPPAVRYDDAVLDEAGRQPDVAATFRVLADGVQSRRTTAARLSKALATRTPRGQLGAPVRCPRCP